MSFCVYEFVSTQNFRTKMPTLGTRASRSARGGMIALRARALVGPFRSISFSAVLFCCVCVCVWFVFPARPAPPNKQQQHTTYIMYTWCVVVVVCLAGRVGLGTHTHTQQTTRSAIARDVSLATTRGRSVSAIGALGPTSTPANPTCLRRHWRSMKNKTRR